MIDDADPAPTSTSVILEEPNHKVTERNQTFHQLLEPQAYRFRGLVIAYLDIAPESLQQPSGTLTIHSSSFIILIILSIRISLDLYPSFWVTNERIGLCDVIRYRCIICRRDYQEDV